MICTQNPGLSVTAPQDQSHIGSEKTTRFKDGFD